MTLPRILATVAIFVAISAYALTNPPRQRENEAREVTDAYLKEVKLGRDGQAYLAPGISPLSWPSMKDWGMRVTHNAPDQVEVDLMIELFKPDAASDFRHYLVTLEPEGESLRIASATESQP